MRIGRTYFARHVRVGSKCCNSILKWVFGLSEATGSAGLFSWGIPLQDLHYLLALQWFSPRAAIIWSAVTDDAEGHVLCVWQATPKLACFTMPATVGVKSDTQTQAVVCFKVMEACSRRWVPAPLALTSNFDPCLICMAVSSGLDL